MDIQWTPRTIKRVAAKPRPQTSFDTICATILRALKPFEEARIAVSDALLKLDGGPAFAT